MKIKEILEEARKELDKNNIEDSGIIARELLTYITKTDKLYLIVNMEENLDEEIYKKFNEKIQEIINGMPIQYITHNQEFMGLNFYVDSNVLIPQPDTEILAESVLNICDKMQFRVKDSNYKNNSTQNFDSVKKIKILDLCTGSGAIAISLENRLKDKTTMYASDISTEALKISEKNSIINKSKVTFIHSDLFKNIKESNFDIIVSNPPYIKTDVIKTLSKQVKNEPMLALDGGKDGLYIYRKIIDEAYKYIQNNGYLCLEIGYDQKQEVLDILKKYKHYTEIDIIKDLSQNDRCIIAKIVR